MNDNNDNIIVNLCLKNINKAINDNKNSTICMALPKTFIKFLKQNDFIIKQNTIGQKQSCIYHIFWNNK